MKRESRTTRRENADNPWSFHRLRSQPATAILFTMTRHPRPQFLVLTRTDCERVLARNRVGRLAFTRNGRVEIEPIGYVADDGWIFFRSAYGTKIESLRHSPFVAFEVDEIRSPFDWESVVVHGTVYMLPEDGAPIEQQHFDRAVTALRTVVPEALTAHDPTPTRQIVYGLHVDQLDGRMATTRKSPDDRARQAVKTAPRQPGPRDAF